MAGEIVKAVAADRYGFYLFRKGFLLAIFSRNKERKGKEMRVLRRFAPLVESRGTCSLIENKFS